MNEITFLVFVNCAQNNGVFFYAIDNLFVSSTFCVSCKVWFAFMRHLESEKTQKTRKKRTFLPVFSRFSTPRVQKSKKCAPLRPREKEKAQRKPFFLCAFYDAIHKKLRSRFDLCNDPPKKDPAILVKYGRLPRRNCTRRRA